MAGYAALHRIHRFLAPDRPVSSDILVVEGWVPDYALKRGLDLSVEQKSRYLLLAGGTVRGEVNPEPGDTYANMAMKRLKRIGGDQPHVHPVPSPELTSEPERDRTYGSALAVKKWLKEQGVSVRSINVLTMGTHARRSRLLFQEAFGPEVEVGVIAIRDREYDPRVWWRYSEGVKEVLSEGAAYLYARFLFQPG
ncbi:MAG: YdcF family protein [Verrucomicrobia bacterium]|nr:YdcF family protein [Verrucomicrobiota bacterium]